MTNEDLLDALIECGLPVQTALEEMNRLWPEIKQLEPGEGRTFHVYATGSSFTVKRRKRATGESTTLIKREGCPSGSG